MDRRIRGFAGKDETGDFRAASIGLRDDLIEAGSRADLAAAGDRGTGKHVAGLRTVDVPVAGLFVVQATHEDPLFAEIGERREDTVCVFRFLTPFVSTVDVDSVASSRLWDSFLNSLGLTPEAIC